MYIIQLILCFQKNNHIRINFESDSELSASDKADIIPTLEAKAGRDFTNNTESN